MSHSKVVEGGAGIRFHLLRYDLVPVLVSDHYGIAVLVVFRDKGLGSAGEHPVHAVSNAWRYVYVL